MRRQRQKTEAIPQTRLVCQQVESHLIAYLKEDLPPDQQQAIQAHLAQCDACAQALRDAKILEAELMAARQGQPTLSREASLRIQEQVYRRMRRSLFVRRTRDLLQMAGAVTATAVFMLALILFSAQWARYLVAPPAKLTPEIETLSTLVAEAKVKETIITSSPALPPETAVIPDEVPSSESPSSPAFTPLAGALPAYLANLASITPGQPPAEVAAEVITAALENDPARLETLFGAMHAWREPALRLWRRIGDKCAGAVTASHLRYKALPRRPTIIARVDVYQDDQYVGELKLRRLNGEWYTVFTTYPGFRGCRAATR